MGEAALRDELAQIAARGAPAQQREASRLVDVLAETPDDAVALAAARQLIDAYLHDPYLERG